MKKYYRLTLVTLFSLFLTQLSNAQCNASIGLTTSGSKCGGTIQTAEPFLLINSDPRSAGMGDAGISISNDANAMHFNASQLAFTDQKLGVSVSYTPWLTNLGVNDIYLANASSFYKFGKNSKQALGFSIDYFSLGEFVYFNYNGIPVSTLKYRDLALSLAYARQINERLAIGISSKFISSNLYSNYQIASNLSLTYKKPFISKAGVNKGDLTIGTAISNIGGKMMVYASSDFLPTNLGIGFALNKPLNEKHRFVLALDFNKLLVPTPQPLSTDPNRTWKEVSPITGILKSFTDAPGGFSEELQEVNISMGVEYWFKNKFALRSGYFYEDLSKGARQYFTSGVGFKYKNFGINVSYIIPSINKRSPLDNTFRFSLAYSSKQMSLHTTQRID